MRSHALAILAAFAAIGCGAAARVEAKDDADAGALEALGAGPVEGTPGPTAYQDDPVENADLRAADEAAPAELPREASAEASAGAEQCEDSEYVLDLIKDNIGATEFSGVVRIDTSAAEGPAGGPPSATGYVNHKYEVIVLEQMAGPPIPALTFYVMADADLSPMKPGKVLFASLCRGKGEGDRFYSPDNGYVFSAPECLLEKVRKIKPRKGKKRSPSACDEN